MAASPSPATGMRSESIDKLMRALKELNEYKIKAQETIRSLQVRLKETTLQSERMNRTHSKEKELWEKEKENLKKVTEKEQTKSQKESEKEKAELDEQLQSMSENLEMVTLDKEIAEEKAEGLEQEVEQLKQELHILNMSKQSAQAAPSANSGASTKALTEENEKLKEALMKLRDFSVTDKQEREKRILLLERENKKLIDIQEKYEIASLELKGANEQIEEYKEALEAANEAEEMVEKLTEQNLKYEDDMAELSTTVQELEELKDIADDLAEHQSAIEKALRTELYAREIENLDLQGQISNLKTKCKDYDRILGQFRMLVKSQQDQISAMKQRENTTMSQATELNTQSQALLNQNLQLHSKLLKSTAIEIDQEIAKLNSSQAEIQIAFIKDVLPEHTFQSDYESLSFRLLTKRFAFKSNIIAHHIEHFQISANKTEEQYSEEELAFYLELSHILSGIHRISISFESTLEHCNVEHYLKMGKLFFEILPSEKLLDQLVSLLREEELSPAFSTDELKNFLRKMEQLESTYVISNVVPVCESLKSEVENVIFFSNSLLLLERKLSNLLERKVEKQTGGLSPVDAIPVQKMRRNIEVSRKLMKTLNEYQPQPSDLSAVRDHLSQAKLRSEKSSQALAKFGYDIHESLADLSSVSSEKFAGVLRSVFQDKVDTEWKWLDDLLSSIYNDLAEVSNMMLSGSVIFSLQSADSSPYHQRADSIRAELSDSVGLKAKLEEKEKEILEYSKQVQIREGELRDAKWKEQSLDKQIQKASKALDKANSQLSEEAKKHEQHEKDFTQALEAIQKDATLLRDENKALKETKEKLLEELSTKVEAKETETVQMTQLDSAEIHAMKSALQYLTNQNTKLKGAQAAHDLATLLPPLPIYTAEPVDTTEPLPSPTVIPEVRRCTREAKQLIKDLQQRRATLPVVDLSGKSTLSPIQQLHTIKNDLELLQKRARKLRNATQTLAIQKGGAAPTEFSSFPTAEMSKSIKEVKPILLGKVAIPSKTGSGGHPRKLVLSQQQFHHLHSVFVK